MNPKETRKFYQLKVDYPDELDLGQELTLEDSNLAKHIDGWENKNLRADRELLNKHFEDFESLITKEQPPATVKNNNFLNGGGDAKSTRDFLYNADRSADLNLKILNSSFKTSFKKNSTGTGETKPKQPEFLLDTDKEKRELNF